MKLVIISDLHDNHVYLSTCLTYCKKHLVEAILCCGDITNNETVKKFTEFNIPIYVIRGNADNFTDEYITKLPNLHYLGRTGDILLANKKIGLCHEPFFIDKLLPKNYDVIFYGHTHKPWLEIKGQTSVINPGTLGGLGSPSTFAVWEMGKPLPELIRSDLI